ncbi:MAG TPA: alpha/beta hydrolase [Alphaproteobacteria bacterium]|nr:alpha/beta hydrolase [Alphaproteobacteria bacterium]HNS43699.1 alpha/beta hydrolase [Alphaproteobacteria bacterium]
MIDDTHPILSQPRFQPPENWDWSFRTLNGIKIRYGQPRSRKIYSAIVLILGGLGDFGEKYFEFCHDLESRNIKPIIIDLPGQGGSGRYLDNPHKRHSAGFDELLKDIHILVDEIVLSAAIDAEDNHKRLPMILFGHSMGGHLALRYLVEYNKTSRGQQIFCAAVMTAPMIKIKTFDPIPDFVTKLLVKFMALRPTAYVSGGSDWHEEFRNRTRIPNYYTHDPERGTLQNAFLLHPEYSHLATGSPTNKWLYDAVNSCLLLKKKDYLEKIDVPVFIALAGNDLRVSNKAKRKAASHIKNCELQELDGASHEILMEKDEYRSAFLDRFFTFLENNVFNKDDKGKSFIL